MGCSSNSSDNKSSISNGEIETLALSFCAEYVSIAGTVINLNEENVPS